MRKIIVGQFISLDGVVEAPDKWHFPYVNDEMFQVMWGLGDRTDTMLLGRVTYLDFAGAFAGKDDPVSARMNKPAKVVVTRTLDELPWDNSTAVRGDVVAEVAALKERPGADILVTGSITLVRTLLAAGLVDELSLLAHPVIVGAGTRLFAEDAPRTGLRLVEATPFSTGVTHLHYVKES